MEQGFQVDEELFRQVRFELLKETTGVRAAKFSRPVPPPAVRYCPKTLTERHQG
jgi:hypothetical protein